MDEQREDKRRRTSWPVGLAALGVAVGLFFGFWGWVYQGYEEDAGTGEFQTWPLGLGGYAFAWLCALAAIRLARPKMSRVDLAAWGLILAALLVLATFGSLDAGNG